MQKLEASVQLWRTELWARRRFDGLGARPRRVNGRRELGDLGGMLTGRGDEL